MKTKSNSSKTDPLKRGLIAGSITLITYLSVVIVTTPNLPTLTAFSAAVKVNGVILFGLAIAIGVQIYVTNYAKSRPQELERHSTIYVSHGRYRN
jgi:predicted MFS family arabinose efflux permease